MSDFTKIFIRKNRPQFLKYKKYLQDNNWAVAKLTVEEDEEGSDKPRKKNNKAAEFKIQHDLVTFITDRIKYFVKKSPDHTEKIFKDFIKESLKIVEIHTARVDSYVDASDISEIADTDMRSGEIAFHNELFEAVSKIEDVIEALVIKDEAKSTSGIEFLNDRKAPLSMHHILSEIYPEIKRKLEDMKIDFECDPGNEMHIYNLNAPVWDTSKHYWEQDKTTLQYYVNEFKKLNDGIVVDGYYISGWFYYTTNVFVTPIPHKVWNEKSKKFVSKDYIINPPLRDSDVFIFENYENAQNTTPPTLFTFIAATRRAAKTTLESSKLGHAATIGKKELLCAGGSTKDLNQIAKNFKTDIQFKNPAFAVYNVSNDWKDKVEMGLKGKDGKTILLSTLNIVNTDGGNNVEILAGYTPDEFVFDEVMKGKFVEALAGLKPALKGIDGMVRCFGLLSGTGGDEALSKDGLAVLQDPTASDVLPMNWELLERGVPNHLKTWEEDKHKPFGTFVPGQMSVDMPKFDSTLAKYLGKEDCPNLNNIKIKVTDWENALVEIEKERKKKEKNRVEHNKQIVYIPIKPSEIFMSGKINPFPVEEAKAHREYLWTTGKWDRRFDLYKDEHGKIQQDRSSKDLAPFPHKGGTIDAPFLLLEDIPQVKPPMYMYSSSFDDYATEDSNTDSLGTFYVWKNEVFGDKFSRKLVASLSIRPEKHPKLYEKWLLLCEAFNLTGTVFGENFNYAFKDYLDTRHLSDKYLASSVGFTENFNIPNNLKRKTGWNPTTCKKPLFNLFVAHCNEDYEVEQEDGKLITIKGVQSIDDIILLDEIIAYNENGNFDRITAAMGAWGYTHYLISTWKTPQNRKNLSENKEEKPEPKKRETSFYTQPKRRAGFYNKPRR